MQRRSRTDKVARSVEPRSKAPNWWWSTRSSRARTYGRCSTRPTTTHLSTCLTLTTTITMKTYYMALVDDHFPFYPSNILATSAFPRIPPRSFLVYNFFLQMPHFSFKSRKKLLAYGICFVGRLVPIVCANLISNKILVD